MTSEKKVKVVFLHGLNDYEKYSQFEPKFFNSSQIKIFSTNIELDLFLQLKNIEYFTLDNYISVNLAKQMDEKAFKIVNNWHKDLFKFREISLGSLVGWELNFFFARIIRNVQSTLNLIELEKPTEIISFDNQYVLIKELNNALKYICSIKKIKFKIVPTVRINTICLDKIKRYSNKDNLRTIVYKSKSLFLKTLSKILLIIKKFTSHKKKILLFHTNYYPTLKESILQTFNLFLMNYSVNEVDFIENLKNTFFNHRRAYILSFDSWISPNIKRKTNQFFNQFCKNWRNIVKDPSFKKQFKYENVLLWPLVCTKIYHIIFLEFRKLIKSILVITKILKNASIDFVVLGNDVTERYMIISFISSKLKIPTLVIQHGITGHFSGYVPSYSSNFATWGKISREDLLKFGMSSKKIVITGCPRFDTYIHLNKNEILKSKIKQDVYKAFKIRKDRKLIVVATNYGLPQYRINMTEFNSDILQFFIVVLEAIKKIPDIHLIIKFHYADNNTKIVNELANFFNLDNVSLTTDYDIVDLIVACDCFISGESTTILEATLVEKPIICLDLNEREYVTPFFEYKSFYRALNSHELSIQIIKAFKEPVPFKNREQFLKDYLYRLDGFSTRRVMNLINNTVRKKK